MDSQRTLIADVLVIGTGFAGVRAAEAAASQGAKVIAVGKGVGAFPGIMGFNVAINPDDSVESHYQDLLRSGWFINNKKLARILAEDSIAEVTNLERLGMKFEKKPDGTYDAFLPIGSSHPRLVHYKALTGHKGLALMGKDCQKMGVAIERRIMITQLLKHRDRVIGAVGIDLRDGGFVSYLAKAVVLTAGGCGAIYPITTYPKDTMGDGYAMAYRAGAELLDMEFLQFEPCCFAYPVALAGDPIPTTMMKEGAVLQNAKGEKFLLKYDARPETLQKDVLARAIATEVAEGRGTKHKAVFYDVTMLPRHTVVVNHNIFYDPALKAGIDLMKEPAEVAPAAHTLMGGVRIDEFCKSSLEGLFSAGEVSGGIHGANRIGGASGAETLTFGARAGKYAALAAIRAKSFPSEKTVGAVIDRARKGVADLTERRKGAVSAATLSRTIQGVMDEHVGIIKNKKGLIKASEELIELEGRLAELPTKSAGQLKELFQLANMITTGKMLAAASLARTESRGVHYRSDFPARQDRKWMKNVIIKQVGGEMKLETRDCE